MGSHSLHPTLQSDDFNALAEVLAAKSGETVQNRLYANGRDGLHLYRVPELKAIAQYLKRKMHVHVPGFSSLNKKDLVEWIFGNLYRQEEGAGVPKRVPRAMPSAQQQSHHHHSHQTASHSQSQSHTQSHTHFDIIAGRITPNPFFEVVQTLAVKDVFEAQGRLAFHLDSTWNSPFHSKARAVHARIFEPLEAWASPAHKLKETAWVASGGLYVNNLQVGGLPKKRKQPHIAANSNFATPPVVLDRFVVPDRNSVTVLTAGERFWFVVQVGNVRSVEEVQSEILRQGEDTGPFSGRSILRKLLGESETDDIACTDLEVSLRCPLSMLRIALPAKGRHCNHLQCFDLSTFLEYAKKHSFWLCPNCHKPLPPCELRLCGLFSEMLRTVSEDADRVRVNPDASFHEVGDEPHPAPDPPRPTKKPRPHSVPAPPPPDPDLSGSPDFNVNPGLDMLALVAQGGQDSGLDELGLDDDNLLGGGSPGLGFGDDPLRGEGGGGEEVIILDSDED